MKVKFVGREEPCLQYEVNDSTPVLCFCKTVNKLCDCINIEVLGLVPMELLEEANHPDNINAIDVFIQLNKNDQ